jgi:hypothetical protein
MGRVRLSHAPSPAALQRPLPQGARETIHVRNSFNPVSEAGDDGLLFTHALRQSRCFGTNHVCGKDIQSGPVDERDLIHISVFWKPKLIYTVAITVQLFQCRQPDRATEQNRVFILPEIDQPPRIFIEFL